MISGYYVHMSGIPWGRTLQIQLPDDPQFKYPGQLVDWGLVYPISAESPGSRRLRSRNNLDIRLEKNFYFGNKYRLGLFFDLINVFGENWLDIDQDSGGIIYNDGTFESWPTYGKFTGAHGLRILKLSARFVF
jgi:hypothetical protein